MKTDEEIKSEQNAFHLVKTLDLIDECYHFLRVHPPPQTNMNYSKWKSLVEETDYMREFNAAAEHERKNNDAQQELQAYRDIIKELIPIASKARGLEFPGDEFVKAVQTIDRAKKLIDTVTPT